MKSLATKVLTVSAFSLLLITPISPVKAASPSGEELKEFKKLPNFAKSAVIGTAFLISGAGVLLGTGKSIKYGEEGEEEN